METARCPIEFDDLKPTLEKKFGCKVVLGTHTYWTVDDWRRLTVTPDELRAINDFLRQKVSLKDRSADGEVAIRFEAPSIDEMVQAGLNPEGCRQILEAPWWDEMATDIVETPEMCDPEDPREQVLDYARDVVTEYIRKRANL